MTLVYERDAQHAQQLIDVLGASTELADAIAFATTHRVSHPALGVVLLRDEVDATVLANALRAGIREVVPSVEMLEVRAACERSLELSLALARVPASAMAPEPVTATAPSGEA